MTSSTATVHPRTTPQSGTARAGQARRSGAWLTPWLTGWTLVLAVTGVAHLLFAGHSPTVVGPQHWDATHYVWIAQHGYSAHSSARYAYGSLAYFPALPALMWLLKPLFGGSALAAGMLISGAATGSAARSMYRYAARSHSENVARWAVWLLCCNPYAFVLFTPFTEPLLLACAIPALAAARDRRWRTAGLLAAAAVVIRITGLFVALAVAVSYLIAAAKDAPRFVEWARRVVKVDALWLLTPVVSYASWVVYQHHLSGRWNTTSYLERTVWYRWTVWPWQALAQTLDFIRRTQRAATGAEYATEIAALAVLVCVVYVLLRRRRWIELAYVAGPTVLLATSDYYSSNQRGLLVAFPVYVLAAAWLTRHPRLAGPLLAVSAALAVFLTVTFDSGMYFTG